MHSHQATSHSFQPHSLLTHTAQHMRFQRTSKLIGKPLIRFIVISYRCLSQTVQFQCRLSLATIYARTDHLGVLQIKLVDVCLVSCGLFEVWAHRCKRKGILAPKLKAQSVAGPAVSWRSQKWIVRVFNEIYLGLHSIGFLGYHCEQSIRRRVPKSSLVHKYESQ